jgi:hypothetical protein
MVEAVIDYFSKSDRLKDFARSIGYLDSELLQGM